MSLEAPLDPADILTSRFVISNAGFLDLKYMRISMFELNVIYVDGSSVEGGVGHDWIPPFDTLKFEEQETVPFIDFVGIPARVHQADIALIASWKLPFGLERERAFRFATVQQKDGMLRLEPQPSGDWVLKQYHDVMNRARYGARTP